MSEVGEPSMVQRAGSSVVGVGGGGDRMALVAEPGESS